MKIYIQNLKYEYELKMLFNSFTRLESQFYHISEYNESDSECIVISENSDYNRISLSLEHRILEAYTIVIAKNVQFLTEK